MRVLQVLPDTLQWHPVGIVGGVTKRPRNVQFVRVEAPQSLPIVGAGRLPAAFADLFGISWETTSRSSADLRAAHRRQYSGLTVLRGRESLQCMMPDH